MGGEYWMFQCTSETCGFRFPAPRSAHRAHRCPKCGAPTQATTPCLPPGPASDTVPPNGVQVEALLDNLRSAYNVGAIFRSADATGVRRLHLCGITPTPEQPAVAKTGLGTQVKQEWIYHLNSVQTVEELKHQGCLIWALETGRRSVPLFSTPLPDPERIIVLVIGNELTGVDPDVLALCDRIVSLPMAGTKESINVAVAFGVAAYVLRYNLRTAGIPARWIADLEDERKD